MKFHSYNRAENKKYEKVKAFLLEYFCKDVANIVMQYYGDRWKKWNKYSYSEVIRHLNFCIEIHIFWVGDLFESGWLSGILAPGDYSLYRRKLLCEILYLDH